MANALMAVVLVGCALLNLLMSSFVWSRREGRAGQALVGLMLATTVWCLSYAVELSTTDVLHLVAGDLKYVGIGAMPIAWLAFTLYWTGRDALVTPRLLIGMAVEPTLVLLLLANPPTHHFVRYVDPSPPPGSAEGYIAGGPVFWFHLIYIMVVMLGTTVVFLTALAKRSHAYRPQVFLLASAAVLPFIASLGFNLGIVPLAPYDLTPVAFSMSSGVLTWGLLQQHLLKLAPVAHSQVVDGMRDGVLVVDALNHVVESNPAALEALGWSGRSTWRGQTLPAQLVGVVTRLGPTEVRLDSGGETKVYEAQVSDLPDVRGHAGGRLVVLRDISERRRLERQRATMLAEQARVAETLSRSLRPAVLPDVPGVALGAVYRPAGSGHEIGGDFYDVFPVDGGWAFSIGDVSGKGARSAAVTALARYTLRALTRGQDTPSKTVSALNTQLISETEDQEIYLTVVHGRINPVEAGLEITLTLGGHPRPVVVPAGPEPIRSVGEPGTAVGLLDDIDTVDTTLLLRPGDAMVMYTDGVTEARRGRDFFGEEGLAEVVEQLRGADADVIAQGVLAAVLNFQEQLAADDIAVLVLQAPAIRTAGRNGVAAAGPVHLGKGGVDPRRLHSPLGEAKPLV